MLTNIIAHWDKIEALKRGEKIWPVMASFHTCNLCNQRCIGCAHKGTHSDEIMPRKEHFKLVDDLLAVGVKAFDFAGGGEPLLADYLPSLFRHIRDKGGRCGLLTNGLALNDLMIHELIRSGTYIRVSLEASCREDYMAYKSVPGEHWDKVIFNLGHLLGAKLRHGSDLEISIKFSVSKTLRGRTHYQRGIDLGKYFGADRVNIKASRYCSEELSEAERIIEEGILQEVIREESADRLVTHWVSPAKSWQIPQCWLNPMQVIFDHLGNMSVCCYRYWDREEELSLGNIYQRPFAELWMDDEHWQKIKRIQRSNCARADCKFFRHHQAVDEAMIRGHVNFI